MELSEFDELVKDGSMSTENILKVRDAIAEYNSKIEALNNEVKQHVDKITELRDVNQKLYLRVTNNVSDTVDTHDATVDDIIKNWEVK